MTLDNAISGDGNLQQIGTGVTSINITNAYSGGTTISAGVLAIGSADALGTGAITMSGGELLGTADETIVDPLSFSGTSTIAAAHGTTLAEDASNYSIAANTILNIGAPGQDGTILWHTNPGTTGGSGDGSLKSKPARSRPQTKIFHCWSIIAHRPQSTPARPSMSRASTRLSPTSWAAARSSIAARLRL